MSLHGGNREGAPPRIGYWHIWTDGNGISLASYIHAIFGLIAQTQARKILMIGCAGGTLATMLAQAGRKVTIIDVNPASFILAKQYFALPDSVECQIADGKWFLTSDTKTYVRLFLMRFMEIISHRISNP